MSMKPILFNTDMVRAILEGRKSVTRRVMKYTHHDVYSMACINGLWSELHDPMNPPESLVAWYVKNIAKPPYQPSDILYVREAWSSVFVRPKRYIYKADSDAGMGEGVGLPIRWRPSIHMPKEAARIFLRVAGVRVERLQNISSDGINAEGTRGRFGATRGAFEILWDSTIKPADLALYGWTANPWVWVIEFERISKDEALR